MNRLFRLATAASLTLLGVVGCGGSTEKVSALQIVATSGGTLTAGVGDALQLSVKELRADGTTAALPASARIAWSGIPTAAALDPSSMSASPFPATGAAPTAFFVANASRSDHATDLAGVVFVLDAGTNGAGTITVNANVSGVSGVTQATATVAITGAPSGDAAHGKTVYASSCASCHGDSGAGSPTVAGSTTMFSLEGKTYDYPAPGLNAADGNVASDPDWSAALFAISSRADLDNDGLTLRSPMPDWVSDSDPTTHQQLTTQDFYDIYAFMATQTQ